MPLFGSSHKGANEGPQLSTGSYYPDVDPLQDPRLGPDTGGWAHGHAKHSAAHSAYPHIPNMSEASAPPLPLEDYHRYGYNRNHISQPRSAPEVAEAPLGPGQVMVAAPKIEAQPWVKKLWSELATKTVGVARVDLRRPTFPWPEDYDTGNILFRRSSSSSNTHAGARGRGRHRKKQPVVEYVPGGAYYPQQTGAYPPVPPPLYTADGTPVQQQQPVVHRQQPTGARLKVMRCVQLKAPENKKALLDFGLGVGVDLDKQQVHGVARVKVADIVSLKLLPQPLLKLGGSWPLPGSSGMAVRLKYEVPLVHVGEFWRPPARLMVRLDNDVGTGVHLTPSGIEFDERRLALGKSTEVRAGATLRFPRTLPIDKDDPDAFKLQVHRLSLKTLW